jgi:hypothetical protein
VIQERKRTRRGLPHDRPTLIVLGVLLAVGLTLRLLLVVAWRPALLGYPDSSVYLEAAKGFAPGSGIPDTVFFDRIRPAGYPIFLRLLHLIGNQLTLVVLVQHALGLAAAVLLYLTVRRIGGPAWLGLVPAAVVLFGGTEVFLEHAAVSESLYIFLTAGALYAAVRATESPDPGWAALSGYMLGTAADVRFLGLVVVPTVAVWLLAARRDSLSGRVLHAAVLVAAGTFMVAVYVVAQRQSTGFTGITQAGIWNLYGRVAGFADCSKFTPPPGTRVLCEHTPPGRRPGLNQYLYAASPATRAFGFPDYGGDRLSSLADNAKVAAFARAAIVHQPLDYVVAVAEDSLRYVLPGRDPSGGGGFAPDGLIADLHDPGYSGFVMSQVMPGYYANGGYSVHPQLFHGLESYERHTRIDGGTFVGLLLLALIGPFVARGSVRAGSALFAIVTLELLLMPITFAVYDARLAVPAFGVLAAGAALGGWSLWTFARATRGGARRTAREANESPSPP